jgi:hypothetical protein
VPHGNLILKGGDMQARYQYGNLTLRKRKKGPDVWQFRWMENGKPKSMLIGTIERYPNQADAERAVEHLRIKVNSETPQAQFHPVTVGTLIDRYRDASQCAEPHSRLLTVAFLKTGFALTGEPRYFNLSRQSLLRTG